MTTNVANQVPYLRTSREFPEDVKQLAFQTSKSYIDIANCVNARTIGLFTVNRPTITGESWFLNENRRQQTLRQVYTITNLNPFPHGINFSDVSTFTKITGIGFDGTNYFPIPFTTSVANAAFALGIFVSPTQVVFDPGASRAAAFQSGIIILEWLSNV